MSNEEKTIDLLKDIKQLLSSNQSDYCDTDEACRIIGVSNYRYLKQLNDRGFLPRYPRADGYRYKKTDLYKIASCLDSQQIVLEPLSKK